MRSRACAGICVLCAAGFPHERRQCALYKCRRICADCDLGAEGLDNDGRTGDRVGVMAVSGGLKGETVSALNDAPESNVRIIQVSGLVKWFDVGRGYGFIIPDNGMQDMLLHLSCLKRDGFEAPLEGTRVVCEAVERQKGYQCLRVLTVDTSTAINPVERRPRTHTTVTPSSAWVRAKVKWFNRARGFGFASEGEGAPTFSFTWKPCGRRPSPICSRKPGSMCALATARRARWRPKCACRSKAARPTPQSAIVLQQLGGRKAWPCAAMSCSLLAYRPRPPAAPPSMPRRRRCPRSSR